MGLGNINECATIPNASPETISDRSHFPDGIQVEERSDAVVDRYRRLISPDVSNDSFIDTIPTHFKIISPDFLETQTAVQCVDEDYPTCLRCVAEEHLQTFQ